MLALQEPSMASWSIGTKEGDGLSVETLGSPTSDEGYDWVPVRVKIHVGAFSGKFDATFLASDMVKFRDELRSLHRDLKGAATFETLEDQMLLRIGVDKLGHISIKGEVRDEAGMGNKLIFEMGFDQTFLTHTIQELDNVVTSFSQQAG